MISQYHDRVTHFTCTMRGGECIGCHCAKCGQGCSWQGHFDQCKPEDIAAHEAHKKMIASLAVTGRQLLADPDANIDELVLANLAEAAGMVGRLGTLSTAANGAAAPAQKRKRPAEGRAARQHLTRSRRLSHRPRRGRQHRRAGAGEPRRAVRESEAGLRRGVLLLPGAV